MRPKGGTAPVQRRLDIDGAAHLVLRSGATPLHPEEAAFAAMLEGWEVQQRSRRLAAGTIDHGRRLVGRFFSFTGEYPWQWQPRDMEDWVVSMLSGDDPISHATTRNYQLAIRTFMDYLCDPRYGWAEECLARFGTHPVQICHEGNSVKHLAEFEGEPGNRPFSRQELQAFFDHADAQVERARQLGRKGWVAAFRDATLFKVAYAWGLRRREVAKLDIVDFGPNAAAPLLRGYGMLSVRWGKATRGSAPRRRNVCTVMPWAAAAVAEYVEEVRPVYGHPRHPALWLTERGTRISTDYLNLRFAAYREELGLPEELGPHCLRHSYVTHLIEDGFDALFVQQQVGHVYSSTTALYTGVSSDYKNRMVQAALERAFSKDAEPDPKSPQEQP